MKPGILSRLALVLVLLTIPLRADAKGKRALSSGDDDDLRASSAPMKAAADSRRRQAAADKAAEDRLVREAEEEARQQRAAADAAQEEKDAAIAREAEQAAQREQALADAQAESATRAAEEERQRQEAMEDRLRDEEQRRADGLLKADGELPPDEQGDRAAAAAPSDEDSLAATEQAEREQAEKELAERQQTEQDAAERQKAEQELAERERAEQQAVAEREKAEQEIAERAKNEQELAEREARDAAAAAEKDRRPSEQSVATRQREDWFSPLNFGLDIQYSPAKYPNFALTSAGATTSSASNAGRIAFEWLPLTRYGKLGIGLGGGVSSLSKVTPTGSTDTLNLFIYTGELFASYRFDYIRHQILVPFVKVGYEGSYVPFEKGDSNTTLGGSYFGIDYGAGIELCLYFLSRRDSKLLDRQYGINDVYLIAEYRKSTASSAGKSPNLEHDEYRVGMRFEL